MDKCCKCEEYHWGLDLKPCYSEDGRHYCIFHTPQHAPVRRDESGDIVTRSLFKKRLFEHIMLSKSKKKNVCNLKGCIFYWDISFQEFDDDNMLPNISFSNAVFCGDAVFCGTCFAGVASFHSCVFKKKADFSQCIFACEDAMTNFINCTCEEEAVFDHSIFSGNSSFRHSKLQSARFAHAMFLCKTNFKKAIFNSDVDFGWVKFRDTARFRESVVVGGLFKMYSLRKCSYENIAFYRVDLKNFTFDGCELPSRLWIDKNDKKIEDCIELYQAMKMRAAEGHDQPQVSHWHYREKLTQLKSKLMPDQDALGDLNSVEDDSRPTMSRVRSWASLFMRIPWPLRRSLLFWYWSTSGFGERPRRAGWCLAFVVVLPLATAALGQIVGVWPPGSFDGAALSGVITDWQRALPLVKVPAETAPAGWKLLWYNVSQLVITIQAALFGFAVRNRFRR